MRVRYYKVCLKMRTKWGTNRAVKSAYDAFRKRGHPARVALAWARAECEQGIRSWAVEWSHDPGADLSFMTTRERAKEHEVLCAVLYDQAQGRQAVLNSLCGIVDPDRGYAREVEAELVDNALHEQAAATAGRQRAGVRAAYEKRRVARRQPTLFEGTIRRRR